MSQLQKKAVSIIIFTLFTSPILLYVHTGCAASAIPLNQAPPGDLNYVIPPLTPIPIQSVWNPDINDDGRIDLVLGKPTVILVNVTGTIDVEFVNVSFGDEYFELGPIQGDILIFNSLPKSTGNYSITGKYIDGSGTHDLNPVNVTVKETSNLTLSYYYLFREKLKPQRQFTDYGTVYQIDFDYMVENSTAFINATYPIENLTANKSYKGFHGADVNRMNSYLGVYYDVLDVVLKAKTMMGSSAIGIAIGPDNTDYQKTYFEYHGMRMTAGLCFGPSTKGLAVQDGYYTGTAHEIGHLFYLYYGPGVDEQYEEVPPNGKAASGVWVTEGEWRTGICFMGRGSYRRLDESWVHNDTYKELFAQLRQSQEDPEILLANGVIFKNGTMMHTRSWYRLPQGTPDTLKPGDYSLVFKDVHNQTISEASFYAPFYVYVSPGIGVTQYSCQFGRVETDFATFAFATEYPPTTYKIQVMDNTDPQNPVEKGVIYASEIKTVLSDANGPYGSEEGSQVTFDASSSLNLGAGSLEYRWDFDGDGTWDTDWSENPKAAYTWYEVWNGSALVNVTNWESFDIDTAKVEIFNVDLLVEAGSNQNVKVGEEISFSGSIVDPGKDARIIEWDLGDGTKESDKLNPTHTYKDSGVYEVTLKVTDVDGIVHTDTLTVAVQEVPLGQPLLWIILLLILLVISISMNAWQWLTRKHVRDDVREIR